MPPPPEVAEGMMTKYVWGSSEGISQCAERRAVYFISGKLPQLREEFSLEFLRSRRRNR
jgi:hypothetical protein